MLVTLSIPESVAVERLAPIMKRPRVALVCDAEHGTGVNSTLLDVSGWTHQYGCQSVCHRPVRQYKHDGPSAGDGQYPQRGSKDWIIAKFVPIQDDADEGQLDHCEAPGGRRKCRDETISRMPLKRSPHSAEGDRVQPERPARLLNLFREGPYRVLTHGFELA